MKDLTHREMIHAVEIIALAGCVLFIAAWVEIAYLLTRIERTIRGQK